MQKILLSILLSSCALTVQSQVATVSMAWSDFTFTLVDLNISDGIEPYLHATTHRECDSILGPFCSARSVQPSFRPSGYGTGTFGAAIFGPTFDANFHSDVTTFILSPNTQLLITGFFSANGSGPQSLTVDDIQGGVRYTYTANAFASSNVSIGSYPGESVFSFAAGVGPTSTFFAGAVASDDTELATSFNVGVLIGGGWNRTVQPIPAIPEPSAYALVGLGMLILLLRRRIAG